MRTIISVHRIEEGHWVGDSFPVRTVFSYQSLRSAISPFLLLDYAGPMTATSGVVHEEMHAPEFTRSGGTLA